MPVSESFATISKSRAYSCDDTLSTTLPCRTHESSAASDMSDMMMYFNIKLFELFGLAKIRNLLALGLFCGNC